jgi:hypothetical protein
MHTFVKSTNVYFECMLHQNKINPIGKNQLFDKIIIVSQKKPYFNGKKDKYIHKTCTCLPFFDII